MEQTDTRVSIHTIYLVIAQCFIFTVGGVSFMKSYLFYVNTFKRAMKSASAYEMAIWNWSIDFFTVINIFFNTSCKSISDYLRHE